MVELTDAQIDAAMERGKIAHLNEPRAIKARYNKKLGRVVIELTNGCTFTFPPHLAQVEILGAGYGLHWEALDADLSVPGLLTGLFGTKAYMARHAGRERPRPRPRGSAKWRKGRTPS